MKILIVDDSMMDRKLLSRTLVNLGFKQEIVQADGAEKAMEILLVDPGQVGLMFIDYQMPGISGIELMSALVKEPLTANIPMIMVTASSAEESRQAAYQANPNLAGYVTKPYKPDDIAKQIAPYAGI